MKENNLGIVIPTYNYADYLEEAILSALATIELVGGKVVVVDDGSTDNTQEIVEKYPQVQSLKLPERKGAAYARNRGSELCDTTYLLFLDSDDVLIPQSIRAMVEEMNSTPDENLIYADSLICDENLMPMCRWSKDKDISPDNQENKLCWGMVMGMPGMLMRRDIFHKVGMFFPLPRVQDWDLAVRFMALRPLSFIDCLAFKRRVFSKTTWERNLEERLQSLKKVIRLLEMDKKFAFLFPSLHKKRFACIYRQLTETCIAMDRYELAHQYIDKVEECVNCFGDVAIMRSQVWLKEGKYQKIIEGLANENRPFFLRNREINKFLLMSRAYEELNDFHSAKGILCQAIDLVPQRTELYYQMAKLCVKSNDFTEAIMWFDRLTEDGKERYHDFHVSGHYNKAKIYKEMGKIFNARFEIERCLKLEPDHKAAKEMLAGIDLK